MSTIEAQAFAFRQLVAHMQQRTDVQNIDQMNLAGFCRNCMAKWLFLGNLKNGSHNVDYNHCLKEIYGMEYSQWKSKFQSKASEEQMKRYKETKALHAVHPKEVEAAAKASKKKASSSRNKPSMEKKKSTTSTATSLKNSAGASNSLSDVCCRPLEEIAAEAKAKAESKTNLTSTDTSSTSPFSLGGTFNLGELSKLGPGVPENTEIRVAILTVSDRAASSVYEDQSGPAIEKILCEFEESKKVKFEIISRKIVADDLKSICKILEDWADEIDTKTRPDLVLTTGGTGFSRRDVTPEATKAVIDRSSFDLATAVNLHIASLEPFSLLSRAIAGIRKCTFIFNLPGRPKAVAENLSIALPILCRAAYDASRT